MIARKLFDRELGRSQTSRLTSNQHFYSNIYPQYTSYDCLPTDIVPKKFSPDGQFFIAFGQNMHSVIVYRYHLPSRVTKSSEPLNIVPKFQDYFELVYESVLVGGSESLAHDVCLISKNQQHMILASAVPSTLSPELRSRNPDTLQGLHYLDDITFWIIDIETGKVTDKRQFLADYIFLTNMSGVNLYDQYFAVTSVQHQLIHIFLLRDNGKLIPGVELGWLLRPDDEMVIANHRKRSAECMDNDTVNEPSVTSNDSGQLVPTISSSTFQSLIDEGETINKNEPLGGIKQRMMTFLYRKALEEGPEAIAHFYLVFSYYSNLVMWRMQFLDSDNILIKFGPLSKVAGSVILLLTQDRENSSHHSSLFVFYCLSSTRVTEVLDSGSLEMFKRYESSPNFRTDSFPNEFSSSVFCHTNNKYAQEILKNQLEVIKGAKKGGLTQAIKRVLSGIPRNPQLYSESPYFDYDLFSYDEKFIGPAEKFRTCQEFPCKFFDRRTGYLKFKLDPGKTPIRTQRSSNGKETCNFIFHPTDPFVLSTAYDNEGNNNVNLHSRHRFVHS